MSAQPNVRLAATKAVLWGLLGIASAVGVVRYLAGLGVTTALSDRTPWGLWIGFDVMAGVALAAGGFVIAAAVHGFHLERYHALVRPAVLTAFLGYTAVVLGLGVVFIGLSLMSDFMAPLRTYQPFLDLMASMTNPLVGILIGALVWPAAASVAAARPALGQIREFQ